MKLLILGNHTCGNRGDSAILRGLIDAITTLDDGVHVDVMSRYPVSSAWLLGRPVLGDGLYKQMKRYNNAAGLVGRVKKVLRRKYQHHVLVAKATNTGRLRNIAIPQGFIDFVKSLQEYDAIIQVGGSFLSIFMASRSLSTRCAALWPASRFIWLGIAWARSRSRSLINWRTMFSATRSPLFCAKP